MSPPPGTARAASIVAAALVASVALPRVGAQAQQVPWPTDGWASATAASQGLDPEPLAAIDRDVRAGVYGSVDRLVVVRNGHLVANHRYERDYREISRGRTRRGLGCGWESCETEAQVHQYNYLHPDFHPFHQGRDVHSLQSVTKSVTATLIGVALQRGEVSGLDVPLLSFFREYDLSGVDPRLESATLKDLLTMRTGIEWHEHDRPLDDTNTTIQLEGSEDWIQFTLDQPMDAAPGERWVYNSGGSHLMSGVIRNATGRFVDEYAEAHLFGPLGIDEFHWKKTPKGYPDTEGGLYLEAEQLAKIGYLYLHDGVWDGDRILPGGWPTLATAEHVANVNEAGFGYGYQWWRLDRGPVEVWAGLGFGGQYLLVLPQYELVAVVNSWNLFDTGRTNILGPLLTALIDAAEG